MSLTLKEGHRETAASAAGNNQKVNEQLREPECLAHRGAALGGHHGCLQIAREGFIDEKN